MTFGGVCGATVVLQRSEQVSVAQYIVCRHEFLTPLSRLLFKYGPSIHDARENINNYLSFSFVWLGGPLFAIIRFVFFSDCCCVAWMGSGKVPCQC